MEKLFKMFSCTLVLFIQPKLFILSFSHPIRLKRQLFRFILLLASMKIIKSIRIVQSLHEIFISAYIQLLHRLIYLRHKRAFLQFLLCVPSFELLNLLLGIASRLTQSLETIWRRFRCILISSNRTKRNILQALHRRSHIRFERALSNLTDFFSNSLWIYISLCSISVVVQIFNYFTRCSGFRAFSVFWLDEFWGEGALFNFSYFSNVLSFLNINLLLFVL